MVKIVSFTCNHKHSTPKSLLTLQILLMCIVEDSLFQPKNETSSNTSTCHFCNAWDHLGSLSGQHSDIYKGGNKVSSKHSLPLHDQANKEFYSEICADKHLNRSRTTSLLQNPRPRRSNSFMPMTTSYVQEKDITRIEALLEDGAKFFVKAKLKDFPVLEKKVSLFIGIHQGVWNALPVDFFSFYLFI